MPGENRPDPAGGWAGRGVAATTQRGRQPLDMFEDLLFRGRRLPDDLAALALEGTLSGGVDQVTEIEVTFADPGLRTLRSGTFALKTPVTFRGMRLHVSVVETQDTGDGQVVVRARPKRVWALRKRRGKYVIRNVSPTDFVRKECAAVGLRVVAQDTGKRKSVSRDVTEKGQTYTPADYPSTWTTFQRLADEVGFICYEWGDTLYFGKPTWLAKATSVSGALELRRNGDDPARTMLTVPVFRHSLDAEDTEFEVSLPGLPQSEDLYPGMGVRFPDIPGFGGSYAIRSLAYPLVGPGPLVITGGTPINPTPGGVGTRSADSLDLTQIGADGQGFADIARIEASKGYEYVDVGMDAACSDNPSGLDCSDFTVHCAWLFLGRRRPPTGFTNYSGAQIDYCRSNGRLVSVSDAMRIPGALLLRTPRTVNGRTYGHVEISLGNGKSAGAHSSGVDSSVHTPDTSYFDHGGLPDFVFGRGSS